MNNLQVVFLLLSSWPSKHFNTFLTLYDVVASAGFHTSIATNPIELCRPCERLRIVVIDGNYNSTQLNLYSVLRMVRKEPSVDGIILLTDKYSHIEAREAGVNVCLPTPIKGDELCEALTTLARKYMLEDEPG